MSVISIKSQASSRGARMLRTALGPEIAAWLEDAAVIEVMLNPDGRLWIDRLGSGIADTGSGMSGADGERIIRLVAHHVGAEVHAKAPRVFHPRYARLEQWRHLWCGNGGRETVFRGLPQPHQTERPRISSDSPKLPVADCLPSKASNSQQRCGLEGRSSHYEPSFANCRHQL